nr:MAG TPA: hypothetical protein [Caudoviricetes sp.]
MLPQVTSPYIPNLGYRLSAIESLSILKTLL